MVGPRILVLEDEPLIGMLELAAIDGHARRGEQVDPTAQLNEVRARSAQRRTAVLAEIGDRFVIGQDPTATAAPDCARPHARAVGSLARD